MNAKYYLLLTLAGLTGHHTASASTRMALSLDTLVDYSNAVALVEPLESSSRWEDGRIATYTHVRVTNHVAGSIGGDAWIKTLGGSVGDVGQWVEGEADLGKRSLVFLRAEGNVLIVVGGVQGQYLAPVADDTLRAGAHLGKIISKSAAKPFALAGLTVSEASASVRKIWEVRHASR
jgi:hypothetical protein